MEFLVDYSSTRIPREDDHVQLYLEKTQQFSLSYQLTEQTSHPENWDKI